MKTLIALLLTTLFILSCDNSTNEKSLPGIDAPLDPFEQNIALGRGINLGNVLEAPNEGEWGVVLKAEWFTFIKNAGFNSVRIPIKWSAHTIDEDPFTINEEFFSRVDWAIEQALKNDLMVIINMHHYDEIFVTPAQESEKFLSIWEQISLRYKNQPKELLFEINYCLSVLQKYEPIIRTEPS